VLESLLMGTPVLVNGDNPVLMEHCRQSEAGLAFVNAREFSAAVRRLLEDENYRRTLGLRGSAYVRRGFLPESVAERLWKNLIDAPGPLARSGPVELADRAGLSS